MPILFSPIPLVNKLLTTVRAAVRKNGHEVERFSKTKKLNGTEGYFGECVICGATLYVSFSSKTYIREGSAFKTRCKPG